MTGSQKTNLAIAFSFLGVLILIRSLTATNMASVVKKLIKEVEKDENKNTKTRSKSQTETDNNFSENINLHANGTQNNRFKEVYKDQLTKRPLTNNNIVQRRRGITLNFANRF